MNNLRRLVRFITLVLAILAITIVYFGLQFTFTPNAYLSLAFLPISVVIVLISGRYMHLSTKELTRLFIILCFMLAFGAFWTTPRSVEVSIGAIASALLMISAYLMARALVSLRLAYVFSAFAFWIVGIPALIAIISGNAYQLKYFFEGSSENYISSWLIITAAATTSAKYYEQGKLSFSPFIIAAFVSFSLFTRGSIAVSILAMLLMVYLKVGFSRVFFIILFASLAGFQYLNDIYDIIFTLVDNTKFGTRGLESPRWEMWAAYLRNLDTLSFFIGANPDYIPEIAIYSGNPHSSFIRLHSYYGGLFLVAVLIVLPLLTWRAKMIHIGMMFIILLRAATDILLVGMSFDIFLMIVAVNLVSSKEYITRDHILNSSSRQPRNVPANRLRVRSRI